MTGRRRPGRDHGVAREPDRGSFTAELAAGLPALMLLLLAGLTAVSAVTVQAQCVDAAREGALASARGDAGVAAAARIAPPGADIQISADGDSVTARVEAPVRLLGSHLPVITVQATAVAAREPAEPGDPAGGANFDAGGAK